MTAARPEPRDPGRQDWTTWPHYLAAGAGFRGYWYPVSWAGTVTRRPRAVTVCGERLVLVRDQGRAYALRDRCPHRGVPLSLGRSEFPGTLSCPYHGWTFELGSGRLCAVITDGPESPIRGKVAAQTYPVAERLGLVWVYLGDGEQPHPVDDQLPEELRGRPFVLGGRIDERAGNWRFACENGFDEGHAKYLHRTSLWRLFKTMPVWNLTRIVRRGRWIYRVQEEVHWRAEFPGLGEWTNYRWWKQRPPAETFNIGNTGRPRRVDPVIAAQDFPGFTSLSLPGVLRVVYPTAIHYEFYVPVDEHRHRYVGVMVNFRRGWRALWFPVKYLGAVRWLFHGQFSAQDAWMVDVTDAPPERLYRPDSSLVAWRKLCEEVTPAHDAERAGRPRRPDPREEGRPCRGRS
jgi:phenylpropionate dioxygenase-like ring-hydroxylating dioxygenase large terminal subunit